ncbi:IclR family transcriptional regulator [Caballeronia sp. LZ065]|uniref:IclR family transcriptional regulator n=1 Tax=Caballeronia sp. LZ065 TaxID=3038571 RepID=UPI00285EAA2F|nr:IclR family transcriptional regulator [Caballeronia sp. LZ065]MDR5782628.1 IclR family transcriptional regulator [Caballeronia sp. LZ065]
MNKDSSVIGAERLLLVLSALASHGKAMSVKDMLGATGLAQSTLYRQVALLKRWGFVSEDSGYYAPGPISLQLALGFDVNSMLVEASRDSMLQLSRATQESVGLIVAVNDQVICLEMIESTHSLRCSFEKGRAVPLRAGASAKSLLAFMADKTRAETLDRQFAGDPIARAALEAELDAIRARGYAVSDSEIDIGVWGVSAPVFRRPTRGSGSGGAAASITLMAPSSRAAGRGQQLADWTVRTANAISTQLQSS